MLCLTEPRLELVERRELCRRHHVQQRVEFGSVVLDWRAGEQNPHIRLEPDAPTALSDLNGTENSRWHTPRPTADKDGGHLREDSRKYPLESGRLDVLQGVALVDHHAVEPHLREELGLALTKDGEQQTLNTTAQSQHAG